MSAEETTPPLRPFGDPQRATAADGTLLAPFNAAGVLAAADVHVARRLCALSSAGAGGDGDVLALAISLAVRAVRLGHVFVDLHAAATTTTVEGWTADDVAGLPWPEPEPWLAAVATSPLTACGDDDPARRPLRLLAGGRLYLDRYWREERSVAADLLALAGGATGADPDADEALAATIARLFPGARGHEDRQALAAATAALRPLTVIVGGPGTGKTTTVARIAGLLIEQATSANRPAPRIALAAPTAKAAARLGQAIAAEASSMAIDGDVRAAVRALPASTLHRLLGWRPDSRSRFRHDRRRPLPHDVVIVDEMSQVSLPLMGRLLEAVRPSARLVLVGDPGQLTSIEAGAVLADVAGSVGSELRLTPPTADRLRRLVGPVTTAPPASGDFGDGIVRLRRGHRFGGTIAELAAAIDRGDGDGAVALLAAGADDVVWLAPTTEQPIAALDDRLLAPLRDEAIRHARAVAPAALAGEARAALDALSSFQVLCAYRRGPHGTSQWIELVEHWTADAVPGYRPGPGWYPGRPVMMTANDYVLHLYNGDLGITVRGAPAADGAPTLRVAFERGDELVELPVSRVEGAVPVQAMTIHKSQGSQFATVAVVLPPADAPALTRELLYTAVTRTRRTVMLVGSEAAVRAAIDRPAARATGLSDRLWGGG